MIGSLTSMFVAVIASFGSEPDTAVTTLHQIFDSCSHLRNIKVSMARTSRDQKGSPFYFSHGTMLSYASPKRFRVRSDAYWGEGALFVSDGKRVFHDPLEGDPSYSALSDNLVSSHPDLASTGQWGSVFYALLAGEQGWNELVPISPHAWNVAEHGQTGVAFTSRGLGTVSIFYVDLGKEKLVTRIDYDNLRRRELSFIFAPFDQPFLDEPLTRDDIEISNNATFGRNEFRVPREKTEKPKKVSY